MRIKFLSWLAACLAPLGALLGHPVAQGAMDITGTPAGLQIFARVSNEEAYVAEAFGRGGPTAGSAARANDHGAAQRAEIFRRHGDYLLEHVKVFADGSRLPGQVTAVNPPANPAPATFIGYRLDFPLLPGQAAPRAYAVSQDVLNEFTFAPGNPWEATYIVRLAQQGSAAREGLLFTRREPLALNCDWTARGSDAAGGTVNRPELFWAFVRHGIGHILSGYDHLLFVSSLVLATVTLADLLKVVTAFTIAHTITLTLAVLNLVRLPSSVVEPMIAASIVFVAVQNIIAPSSSRGWSRLAVAFGFGLFHGLGFAGGLLGAMEGMSLGVVLLAIAAFSLGVELGHQMVSLPLFFGLRWVRRASADNRVPLLTTRIASGLISAAGMVYLVVALRA